jgi:hypothetical protein
MLNTLFIQLKKEASKEKIEPASPQQAAENGTD